MFSIIVENNLLYIVTRYMYNKFINKIVKSIVIIEFITIISLKSYT